MFIIVFSIYSVMGCICLIKKKGNEMIEILMDLTVTMRSYQIIDNQIDYWIYR